MSRPAVRAAIDVAEKPSPEILPRNDKGRSNVSGTATDEYVFRAAPLRNVALRAPYFHSGQVCGRLAWRARPSLGRSSPIRNRTTSSLSLVHRPVSSRRSITRFYRSEPTRRPPRRSESNSRKAGLHVSLAQSNSICRLGPQRLFQLTALLLVLGVGRGLVAGRNVLRTTLDTVFVAAAAAAAGVGIGRLVT